MHKISVTQYSVELKFPQRSAQVYLQSYGPYSIPVVTGSYFAMLPVCFQQAKSMGRPAGNQKSFLLLLSYPR